LLAAGLSLSLDELPRMFPSPGRSSGTHARASFTLPRDQLYPSATRHDLALSLEGCRSAN